MNTWLLVFKITHKDGTQRMGVMPKQSQGAIEDCIIDLMQDDLAETISIVLDKVIA